MLALRIKGNRLLSDWFCAVRLGDNSPFSLTEFTDGQALRQGKDMSVVTVGKRYVCGGNREKICLW